MENEYLDILDEALNDVTSQKSDSDLYVEKINNALNNSTNKRGALSDDTTYFGGQGFGDSRYDDYTLTEAQFEGYGKDVNEMRAQRQPWLDKVGAGLARVGNKIVTEVAKMPGVIGGVLAAPASDNPWETAFNNSWIKTIEDWSQHINNEALPVYVKKSVAEGNLWDNISSVDFWATEGADGIGFIASMFVPGLALSKIGAGSKIVKGLSKAGQRVLGSNEKALDLMKQLGITSNNVDVFNATMANTLFEAGAESGHAMQNFEDKLKAQLESGEITEHQFNELILGKGELGRNVFVSNMGILLGPNLIANKILLGKGKSSLNKNALYKKDTKNLLDEISKVPGKKRVLNYLKEYGKGFLREGFFEEGLQSTVENLYGEAALQGRQVDLFGELGKSYLDMLNTTEGQKAIFLGGFLGGPMNVYQGYKNEKADLQKKNNLLKAMNNSLSSFNVSLTDVYKKNEDGSYVLDKNNKRVIDPIKSKKVGASINQIEDLNNALEIAEITGNKELADNIRSQINSALVVPFITEGEVGLELLRDQLEGMSEIKDNVEKYNQAYGTKLTKNTFVNDIIRTAEKMQEDYQRYSTFGKDVVNIKNDEASPSEILDYQQSLQNSYLLTKARSRYIKDYLSKLKSEKSKLDSEFDLENINEEEIESVKLKNPLYKNISEKINETENLVKDLKQQEDAFFNEKLINKEFSKLVKLRKEEDSKLENEEDKKVDKVSDDINTANTQEQVDEVVKDIKEDKKVSKGTKEYVDNLAETKKDQIEEAEQNEGSEQINKINQEANESLENNSYKTGDEVVIDNENYILTQEGDNEFRLVGLTNFLDAPLSGQTLTTAQLSELIGEVISKKEENNPLDSTEGGEITKDFNVKNNIESINSFNNEGDGSYEKNTTMPTVEQLEQDELTREHVKVLGLDQFGKPLSFVSPNFIEYLNNGISKIGDKVTFEIGNSIDSKSKDAIDFFENLPSNIKTLDDLINMDDPRAFNMLYYLPLKVITKEGHSSFLTTRVKDKSSQTAKEIFNQNELPLRANVITKALENNKSFSGITSIIEFQYPGLIQKAPKIDGRIPEGNILDLYNVEKPEDVRLLFSSNSSGDLFNENKKEVNDLAIKVGSKPGYVYMEVPMANGRRFPMKLNVSKVKKDEAELIFRLYQEILSSKEDLSIAMTLENLSETTQNNIKENFKDELALFNIPFADIKAYEFIELFVYSNPNTNYRFMIKDGSLNYGTKRANKNALLEFKNDIVNWLQSQKRRHIDIKALSGNKNIDKSKYKKYIIERGILNTDTILNEPIFQGNTNIYISQDVELGNNKKENTLFDQIQSQDINIDNVDEIRKNVEESVEDGFDFMQDAIKQNKPDDYDSLETKC